jgi:Ala-tRNA(Pro) deacylase
LEQKRKVYEELNQFGIHYTIIEHPAVFTIDEMASLDVFRDNPWVVKNLFLRDAKGKRHFLVVMDKDKKADLKYIRKQLGTSTLSFASEDRLTKYLNLTKGSVTPFGIINDEEKTVEVVLDRSLVGREYIGVHPNENTATVMLSYRDLYKFIETHSNQIHIIDI